MGNLIYSKWEPFLVKHQIKHAKNLRADAAWALYQILESGQSSREIMPIVWQRHHKPQDKAWLKQMIYGVLQQLPSLQIWLRKLLNKPLKKQQKIIEHLLLLGLYQLVFARTSEHAAVSETVHSCRILKQNGLSGLVNAILREFLRSDDDTKRIDEEYARLGMAKWVYKALYQAYPDQLERIAEAIQKSPPIWLRTNTIKISVDDFCESLRSSDYEFEQSSDGFIKLIRSGDITQIPGFSQGWFSVQDRAAQYASKLLNVNESDVVLDCCAAPGGKTAAILESAPNLKHLYALDIDQYRLTTVEQNLTRLGHDEYFDGKISLIEADASLASSFEALPMFDKILLDAPCSALGVLRRHPDIMWHRKRNDIEQLCALQNTILKTVWQRLKPGGTLLYATCSVLPEENALQVEKFVSNHSDARFDNIDKHGGHLPYWQILPGEGDMDGFFYARLIKCL